MGTDYIEVPDYKSKAMEEVFERFKNPDEDPTKLPRVVDLMPYKTKAPSRLGPFEVYLDYVDIEELEEVRQWTEADIEEEDVEEVMPAAAPRKPSFGLPLGYLDPELEKAQTEIKAWADKKMTKMYQIREEVMKELQRRKDDGGTA
uniref:E3 ubiquitin-protein ligase ptr1 n=1 Tax=Lygus hesperus TaxID=30085 RepID=A0A0A9YC75_LYGHE